MTQPSQGPPPSDMDQALLRIVTEAVGELPEGAASLTHLWHGGAGMWFVEVHPRESEAARLSVAFDGLDLLNVTVGNIWFERFPIETVDELVQAVRPIAEAVFRGRVEESGFRSDAYGRIFVEEGLHLSVGRAHLPWPWSLRPFKRHYQPYTTALT